MITNYTYSNGDIVEKKQTIIEDDMAEKDDLINRPHVDPIDIYLQI